MADVPRTVGTVTRTAVFATQPMKRRHIKGTIGLLALDR